MSRTREIIKRLCRAIIPLEVRKRLAVRINGADWIDRDRRAWWSQELVRDVAERDINEYHGFLWRNHLAYAAPYDVASSFGDENVKQSRKMFFKELTRHLRSMSLNPETDVKAVYDVGCSLGYQLRYIEENVFQSAAALEGIDIDRYAIDEGSRYLRKIGSKVRIRCADMLGLDEEVRGKTYDVVICTGVLMYLDEAHASETVRIMLDHSRVLLGMAGLADPGVDNSLLPHSVPRERDDARIHNLDEMVRKAGGRVVARRWDGDRLVDGHGIYFVFAAKP